MSDTSILENEGKVKLELKCSRCGQRAKFYGVDEAEAEAEAIHTHGWDYSGKPNQVLCPGCKEAACQLTDEDIRRTHYTSVPNMVWLQCEDVWEFTLWCVVKQLAWENSQCLVTTPELAALTMMSTGKVSECRKSLLKKGLLKGGLYKDPGYEDAVWHLRVPMLWAENQRIMEGMGTKEKIRAKQAQRAATRKPQKKRGGRGYKPEVEATCEDDELPY